MKILYFFWVNIRFAHQQQNKGSGQWAIIVVIHVLSSISFQSQAHRSIIRSWNYNAPLYDALLFIWFEQHLLMHLHLFFLKSVHFTTHIRLSDVRMKQIQHITLSIPTFHEHWALCSSSSAIGRVSADWFCFLLPRFPYLTTAWDLSTMSPPTNAFNPFLHWQYVY